MRTKAAIPTLALVLMACFAFSIVPADDNGTLKVSVPFAFTAGETKLPSGAYSVLLDPTSVHLVNVDNPKLTATVSTFPGQAPETPGTSLVFHVYGDHRYLSEIHVANGLQLEAVRTGGELQMEKKFGSPSHQSITEPAATVLPAK